MVITRTETDDGVRWVVPRWFVATLTTISIAWVLWVTGGVSYSLSRLQNQSEYTALEGVALAARVQNNERKLERLADKEWLTEKFNGIELRLGNLERRTYE